MPKFSLSPSLFLSLGFSLESHFFTKTRNAARRSPRENGNLSEFGKGLLHFHNAGHKYALALLCSPADVWSIPQKPREMRSLIAHLSCIFSSRQFEIMKSRCWRLSKMHSKVIKVKGFVSLDLPCSFCKMDGSPAAIIMFSIFTVAKRLLFSHLSISSWKGVKMTVMFAFWMEGFDVGSEELRVRQLYLNKSSHENHLDIKSF